MEHSASSVNKPQSAPADLPVLYLIKVGEIALKGENRSYFEAKLRHNIRRQLHGIDCTISGGNGRFYLRIRAEDEDWARQRLATVFGITSYSKTVTAAKEMGDILRRAQQLVGDQEPPALAASFKVEARRTDKRFPLDSYAIASEIGAALLARFPSLKVDVHHPGWTLNVEIRERAYLYVDKSDGPKGLPVGTAGRGILLLSGGIDSPVAGYLMAKRGMKLAAAYFHAYPYTSDQAREKVESLAGLIAPFLAGVNLYVVPFTECQMRIKERAADEEVTLLMRACMMRIATLLAKREDAGCLVTGESLGQVASQTLESMRFTESATELPVFRPLVGMDKEEIIAAARRIGTFETSILPYEDCCTIFSPRHPLIHPNFERMQSSFGALEAEDLLAGAAEQSATVKLTP